MIRASKLSDVVCGISAVAAVVALPVTGPSRAAATEAWPSRVVASYKVTFNGFDVGSFTFTSDVNAKSYTLTSSAEMSALLGVFKWQGSSRSSGAVVDSGEPKPAGYTFEYKSNSKQGTVRMGFTDTRITNVSMVPPSEPHPEAVPVKEHHLKDVLDPLSAVMAVTRGTANPCGRKLAIFDGKQRFDLIFSFRRQQKIEEKRPTGQPGFAFVCRVRYVPIAGYRMTDETREMSASSAIEIALRPVPSANLVVPYLVTIPTFAGTATMALDKVAITTPGKGQIALVQ